MTKPTTSDEQQFLDDLDKKLWNAADRLRSNLDAAVYKHAVLGLIFLKYVSDAFDLRRAELETAFHDRKNEYFLDPAVYKSKDEYEAAISAELEDRDYFTTKNVFWVPPLARWRSIRESATLAPDTHLWRHNLAPVSDSDYADIQAKALHTLFPDKDDSEPLQPEEKSSLTREINKSVYTFRSVARLIDDALEAVEKENPRLKGVIEKNRYMQLQLEPDKLIGLISEVISSIPFRHASLNAKDILGHVYEYFLGQFALAFEAMPSLKPSIWR